MEFDSNMTGSRCLPQLWGRALLLPSFVALCGVGVPSLVLDDPDPEEIELILLLISIFVSWLGCILYLLAAHMCATMGREHKVLKLGQAMAIVGLVSFLQMLWGPGGGSFQVWVSSTLATLAFAHGCAMATAQKTRWTTAAANLASGSMWMLCTLLSWMVWMQQGNSPLLWKLIVLCMVLSVVNSAMVFVGHVYSGLQAGRDG